MQYLMKYAHGSDDTPGMLTLDAEDDQAAREETKKFVTSGYRNKTWASVELSEGDIYMARNSHGNVIARTIRWQ